MSYPPHGSFQDPYQTPHFSGSSQFPSSSPPPRSTPGAWIFYLVYCVFMVLIYALLTGLGVMFMAFAENMAKADKEVDDPIVFVIMGGVFFAFGLVFLLAFAAGPLVPRNRFGWIYGIVLIALGLMNGCTLIFSIPLLIFWLQKDIKQYYGVN